MPTLEPQQFHPLRLLRRHHAGVIRSAHDPHPAHISSGRFVHDGSSGLLVVEGEEWSLREPECVLVAPSECNDDVQVLLEVLPGVPGGEPAVWFEAYHPRRSPEADRGARRLVLARARCVRTRGRVLEVSEAELVNPLRAEEAGLCRAINADRATLSRLCTHAVGARVDDPVAVGADPFGVDARWKFGVVRLEFPDEAGSAGDARRLFADLLRTL